MITRLLVANRGEIASRVFRTCRERGIGTVAVFSDADASLPYVAEADAAVRLPGTTPAETYLRAEALVDAALSTGADAVHPGYGFLAENAGFARAVEAAGLTWVGPPPGAIELMGSKVAAKEHAVAVGVPVLSVDEPTEDDLPLLVKASAGGGGRGMRVVRDLAALDAEVAAAREEAASAFGDGTVFVEPYVEHGRHVEVQVWADAQGGVSVLGDRDCSLQRRHQKVVEEAPAPGLLPETREAMHAAARALVEPLGYRGAGTVELLMDATTQRFWFLEMNTRLQVEHPVTEEVTGLDLVGLQLDACEQDGPLEIRVGERGHAIEVRLYAEDDQHRPTAGTLTAFAVPDGVRLESTYAAGDEVTPYYDGMLAKVVAHAATREQAARKLAGALARARVHGLVTNRDRLVGLLRDPDFLAGGVSTSFLGEHPPVTSADARHAVLAAAVAVVAAARERATVQVGVPAGWRSVTSGPQTVAFDDHEPVSWWGTRDGPVLDDVDVVTCSPASVTLESAGVRTTYATAVRGLPGAETVDVDWSGPASGHVHLVRTPRFSDPALAQAAGSLTAPMPGTVVRLVAEQGASVSAGETILVLEAMKMQHTVTAPADGVVTEVAVAAGQQVAAGEVLAVVGTVAGAEEQA
ncbi:biotin carboxylase N-terminal domain-containing protein [Nocardioides sp. CFH 31398]|uniref:acetyl/propionyl/methylcrotonyl-CoA carboxylase subunit alpha n=1 Tax=Nocardioides sp. CFH 31398 TaxID=2919579 RepID=UPI001F05D388|nr:biotin carboxylase N-terminal domain-containing protein [Nocardioides sp. CFH 31398]MCH1867957.1 biotin/lipoyl-binding protein [Nocardioides sp. CFH 31398]